MKLETITNPQALLDVMQHCHRQAEAQKEQGQPLPAYLSEQLAPQIASFSQAYLALTKARELLGQVRYQMRKEERALRQMLRDGYHCVRRYAKRQQNPSLIHAAFGLHHSGRFPQAIKDLPSPTLLAQRMLEANASHSPQGDNILRLPNPAELNAQNQRLIQHLNDYHQAQQIEREALQEMRQQNEQSQTLLLSIKAHLRIQSRNKSTINQRQLLTSYGFRYKTERKPAEPPTQPTQHTVTNTKTPVNSEPPTHTLHAEGDIARSLKATHSLAQDFHPGCHAPNPTNATHHHAHNPTHATHHHAPNPTHATHRHAPNPTHATHRHAHNPTHATHHHATNPTNTPS